MQALRKRIAALPYPVEIAVVMVVVFGFALHGSFVSLIHPTHAPPITEPRLRALLVLEPLLAVLALGFLWMRGWHPETLGWRPSLRGTIEGVALAFASWFVYVFAYLFVSGVLHIGIAHAALVAPGISPLVAVAASIVNPVFEETFVAGYLIATLRDRQRSWLGINLSVAIRLSYHLYQGAIAVLSILPTGLLFALWYVRTGRLWPLIVAHALLDFVGLTASR